MNSKISSIYSGLGMGLLLGIIMGLSISPVVKTVMGVLATALGGFLAYHKNGNEENKIDQNLRLGSFGLAVVTGIFVGLITRTNELFSPTIKERITQWTDAGYSLQNAKRYVLYQKLGIDPHSGEVKELGEIQKAAMSNLFSSEKLQKLSTEFDPDKWSDFDIALLAVQEYEIPELEQLLHLIKKHITPINQMNFLKQLQFIFFDIQHSNKTYSSLPEDHLEWTSETLQNISEYLIPLNEQNKITIILQMKRLFRALEPK